jgi:hypothetical protein
MPQVREVDLMVETIVMFIWIMCGLFTFGWMGYNEYKKYGKDSVYEDTPEALLGCIILGPFALAWYIYKNMKGKR